MSFAAGASSSALKPELQAPAELYYNEGESARYTRNSHIRRVQRELTERTCELAEIPDLLEDSGESERDGNATSQSDDAMDQDSDYGMMDLRDVSDNQGEDIKRRPSKTFFEKSVPMVVLDLGCGSGLSSAVVARKGHYCIGMDLSPAMLDLFYETSSTQPSDDEGEDSDNSNTGAVISAEAALSDMGEGVPFRPGTVDAIISISALQWLFHSHSSAHIAPRRLSTLFRTCHAALRQGARAVFQFYPDAAAQNSVDSGKANEQMDMLTRLARRAGFLGGLVVDNAQSQRKRRYFLCLQAGGNAASLNPIISSTHANPVDQEDSVMQVASAGKRIHFSTNKQKKNAQVSRRDWILQKKETARKRNLSRGHDDNEDHQRVRPDTKYTGRKRRPRF